MLRPADLISGTSLSSGGFFMTTITTAPARAKTEKIGKPSAQRELPVKIRQTRMLINGVWQNAISGRTFETINPATGEVIAKVAEGEKPDIDKAVLAARQAFEKGAWRKMSARERG